MKKLEIPLIEALNEAWIESAGDLLEDSGYKSVIETLNWPDLYAYKPITYFFIGRSSNAVFL